MAKLRPGKKTSRRIPKTQPLTLEFGRKSSDTRSHLRPATMDFASLMSKQISKSSGSDTKKEPKSDASSTTTTTPTAGPKKFINRREAEAAREAAYRAEQAALESERAAKAAAKRRREEDAAEEAKVREEKRRRLAEESRLRREEKEAEEERARRKRLGLPELPPPGAAGAEGDGAEDEGDDDGADIPEEELIAKLREMGQPVALFGESHLAKLKRFRRLTGPVMDTTGPIATTLAAVEEKDMKVSDTVPKASDKAARKWLYRQLTSYFNMVLREWEIALAKEGNRDTSASKAAISAMLSSKETMKPVCSE